MNNQKVIKSFHRESVSGHLYATIKLDSITEAMRTLSGPGFKLWIFLAKNSSSLHDWKLFSSNVTSSLNISRYQYNAAISELIDHRYLVHTDKNEWEFYETASH